MVVWDFYADAHRGAYQWLIEDCLSSVMGSSAASLFVRAELKNLKQSLLRYRSYQRQDESLPK